MLYCYLILDAAATQPDVVETDILQPLSTAVSIMQGLKELVVGEEQVLFQASNALSQCAKRTTSSGAPFIGSAEAVECHRLLLLASTRVQYFVCTLYSILLGLLRPPIHFDRLFVIKKTG